MTGLPKNLGWTALVLLLAGALWFAFTPSPLPVEVTEVRRGELQITVDDDGRTRVRDRFTISAPIEGRLLRPPLRAGDLVEAKKTVVAEFAPTASSPLDPRARREAQARVAAAEAALEQAEANRARAEAEARYARAEHSRARGLFSQEIVSRDELERVERDRDAAEQALRAGVSALHVAQHDLDAARALLVEEGCDTEAGAEACDRRLPLMSPVDGRVLRVYEESARTLEAGTPILDVGDVSDLEVVSEYLSQDAVRVRPGMKVLVEGWRVDIGGDDPGVLRGRVRVVEPGGFTKVSALGVEEQRVNVVIDPAGDAERWAALGDGYRVETRIVLWESPDAVVVPTGALFRSGGGWSVFLVESERARRREVAVGHMGGLEAEVLEGLAPGDTVILYPSELVEESMRVEPRRRG